MRSLPQVASPRLPSVAEHLDALELIAQGDWADLEIGGDHSGGQLENVSVSNSRLLDVTLIGTDLEHLRLIDCELVGCDLSGATLHEASFTRVCLRGCRLSGADLSAAHLRDVSLLDCRCDEVNLRYLVAHSLYGEHCDLRRADFYRARVENLALINCDLSSATFSQAKLSGAYLRGSKLADVVAALDLRGVIIDAGQVVELALPLVRALDIVIDDAQ